MKKVLVFILLAFSYALEAQNNPYPLKQDRRIREVVFKEHDVVPLVGHVFTTTEIRFSPSEKVVDMEGGDTAAWMVTYHEEVPNTVFVKPTLLGSKTNLTIITNLHHYYFALTSHKALEGERNIYALQFIYPQKEIPARKNVKPSPVKPRPLNTAYRFSGSPELVPLHVFDDGRFTYFELSEKGAIPAIFAVDDKSGKDATVNTRRQGKYLVVQRIAPQFTLRLGGLVTSIFNTPEINRIQAQRRPQ
jgi:type IV secretion system protein VirB9